MKIIYIATYPPRRCGIGTFTHNKFNAIKNTGTDGIVVAINDRDNEYDYPEEVKFTIKQHCLEDYRNAADFINSSGADVCILEHEYGIFGGEAGLYILSLLHRLRVPVIAVLHTVLRSPSYSEKTILMEIMKMAAKTVVMTQKAVDFLTTIYGVQRRQIEIIPHGVPDLKFCNDACKQDFKLAGKKVLMTFGLLGRNKGIETVIKALPPVVKKHPETVYIVLGKTHPAVVRHAGEEYREYLQQLVKDLQLDDHVIFINEFTDEEKLVQYLSATDIYITPYLTEAQITSGTLSYAAGAGCAILSTPYWHAAELLTEGRGRLFDFNNATQLSEQLMELLDKPAVLNELKYNAYEYGRQVTWPQTAKKYLAIARDIAQQPIAQLRRQEAFAKLGELPPFSLDHVRRITDKTGIIQHATYGIANLKEGYCLDDNGRALLMILMAYKEYKTPIACDLIPVYLGYMHYMQNEDGTFRNFLAFNGNFLDEQGSEDSFGRGIWALGYLLDHSPTDAWYQTGKTLFLNAVPVFDKLQFIRAIANTVIGVSYYMQHIPGDMGMMEQLKRLVDKLVTQYDRNATDDWKWFEDTMTYDNAILPLALLHAAEVMRDDKVKHVAMESMRFLTDVTMKDGYLSVIGNENWYTKGGERSIFAQQPVDAMAMVLMFRQAYLLTGDKVWLEKLYTSFRWFLGENDLRVSMYDAETHGCCDGLESDRINRNQGAESTLAYLISRLAVAELIEAKHITVKKPSTVHNMHFMHENVHKKVASL